MTKCTECRGPMVASEENYQYDADGLAVTLRGVTVHRCGSCGNDEVDIPRIAALNRAIATTIAKKGYRLMPAEIRFLRKYLGWSGTDFAAHMGVRPETVSKWENGKQPMDAPADRLLRTMVAIEAPVRDYSVESLKEIRDEAKAVRFGFTPSAAGWVGEGAAP